VEEVPVMIVSMLLLQSVVVVAHLSAFRTPARIHAFTPINEAILSLDNYRPRGVIAAPVILNTRLGSLDITGTAKTFRASAVR
jgi:hypothetical protein